MDFGLIFILLGNYDEPEILLYKKTTQYVPRALMSHTSMLNCPTMWE